MPARLFSSQVASPADVGLLLFDPREMRSKDGLTGRQLEEKRSSTLMDPFESLSYPLRLLGFSIASPGCCKEITPHFIVVLFSIFCCDF
jgi:hypothetical protein